jgi:hypothetical protein
MKNGSRQLIPVTKCQTNKKVTSEAKVDVKAEILIKRLSTSA